MKKHLLFALMAAAAVPQANAQTFLTDDGLEFSKYGSTATLTSGAGYSGGSSLVIPSTVEYDGEQLTVIEILSKAFYEAEALKEVTLPEELKYIYSQVFNGNYLTTLHFNASQCRFYGSSSRPIVDSGEAFTTLTFGDNVKAIPDALVGSYYNTATYPNLQGIELPAGVETIGSYAFKGYTGWTELTITEGVQSVGSEAFNGDNLTTLYFNATNCQSFGGFAYTDGSEGAISTVTIGESVTRIPDNFLSSGSVTITQLTIPDAVEYVGRNAFHSCTSLQSLSLPATPPVTTVDVVKDLLGWADCQLLLPDGSEEQYKGAWPWAVYFGRPEAETGCMVTMIDVWGNERAPLMLTDGLSFGSNGMNIIDFYSGEVIYKLDIEGIKLMKFNAAQEGDAVHGVEAEVHKIRFTLSPTGIVAEGLPEHTTVTAHSASGAVLFSAKATGRCTIQRSTLPKGIVIIKAGTETLKLMNR